MDTFSLNTLSVGHSAQVAQVCAAAAMRRRLMDIGLIPGAQVTCVAKSPSGDPAAYLICGAVIALRNADAAEIQVQPSPAAELQPALA